MTFLLYIAWIFVLALTAGEFDRLVSHRLFARYRISAPETHWIAPPLLSVCLPGGGQVLNSQPIKGLMLFLFMLLLVGTPQLRPWQFLFLRDSSALFPFWLISVGDALLVSASTSYRRRRQFLQDDCNAPSERQQAMVAYLNRRKAETPEDHGA